MMKLKEFMEVMEEECKKDDVSTVGGITLRRDPKDTISLASQQVPSFKLIKRAHDACNSAELPSEYMQYAYFCIQCINTIPPYCLSSDGIAIECVYSSDIPTTKEKFNEFLDSIEVSFEGIDENGGFIFSQLHHVVAKELF